MKSTRILGVHSGHDSSAALIVDGRIVADVAEERFSRIKHDAGLPLRSIDYCLKSQGITMADVDMVAVPASSSMPSQNQRGLKRCRARFSNTSFRSAWDGTGPRWQSTAGS